MALKPCPICGGGRTEIRENTYWTGMRYNVSNVQLLHWCAKQEDDYVTGTFSVRARTAEQAIKFWNGDHGP